MKKLSEFCTQYQCWCNISTCASSHSAISLKAKGKKKPTEYSDYSLTVFQTCCLSQMLLSAVGDHRPVWCMTLCFNQGDFCSSWGCFWQWHMDLSKCYSKDKHCQWPLCQISHLHFQPCCMNQQINCLCLTFTEQTSVFFLHLKVEVSCLFVLCGNGSVFSFICVVICGENVMTSSKANLNRISAPCSSL